MQKEKFKAVSKKLVDKTGLIHHEDNRCLCIGNSSVIMDIYPKICARAFPEIEKKKK